MPSGVQHFTALDPAMTKNHEVWLSSLMPGTTYVFRVFSHDAAGNEARSPENTFDTPALGGNPASAAATVTTGLSNFCSQANLLLLAILAVVAIFAAYWFGKSRRPIIRTKK